MTEYNKEPEQSAKIDVLLTEQSTKEVSGTTTENPINSTAPSNINQAISEMSENEKAARAIGWKSQDERVAEGKDNKFFVDADEYLRRQPLFNIIDKQKRELENLRRMQNQTQSNIAMLRKEGYEQALKDIENRQEHAAAEANLDEFKRLKLQANSIQDQMRRDPIVNVAPIQPSIDPELLNFQERNTSWYNANSTENQKMKAAADAVDSYLVQQANIDKREINVKEHLKTIEAEVQRLFPHRFENRTETRTVVPSVAKSTVNMAQSKLSFNNRLDEQQLEIYNYLKTKNPNYKLDDYAMELDKLNALKK